MHAHSRRGFLERTLGACWAGASLLEQSVLRAAQARAQAPAAPSDLFRLDRIADGVYAAVARAVPMLNSNAVIFEISDGLLVVDTHTTPSAAAALAAQIRMEVSAKPVRYIVATHFHGDHIQGTSAYRKASPQAELLASTATRNLIAEAGGARLRRSLEWVQGAQEDYRRKLAAAKTAEEKAHWESMVRDARAYLDEVGNMELELPHVTFSRDLVLHDKTGDLHLAFRGRAHTAGDVVVYCPRTKVLASGDLTDGFLPYMGDGYPREWPGTIRAVAEFPFEAVASGHGPVQRTRSVFNGTGAYIEELTAAVERGKQQGRTLEELQKSITPGSLRSLETDGYGAFVAASLAEYTLEARGQSAAQILEGGVAGNVADVYKTLERS